MQLSEALVIELCNCQRDVGALRERIVWLQWRLEQFEDGDRESIFIQKRIEMAEMQLKVAQDALSKLYKEMYE